MRNWSKEKTRQMEVINKRAGYYRENPHRFAEEFLNFKLKIFQCILLNIMFISTKIAYIAARGQGKSLIAAIFCVTRCILYPGTQICIASGSLSQAAEIIEKIILILMPKSPLLRNEILESKNNTSGSFIIFRNGSYIKTVTATDNSRHNRANILIIDEFRMVKKHIVDTVLKKFLTSSRDAGYLQKPEYEHLKERNKQIFLTSAYFKKHWAWDHVKSYCVNMVSEDSGYFVCGLPYQLSVAEGILLREDIEDEMSEIGFNSISFDMESGCLWYGESEDALFSYDDLVFSRKLKTPFYLPTVTDTLPFNTLNLPSKTNGEIRVVVADIAVMASKKHKNDATSIIVLQLIPTNNNQYLRNLVFSETIEGGHSETQAIRIRKIYEEMQCDYIVIDTNGVGNGIYDELVTDLTDPDTGEVYPAFTCMNDETMAVKYKGSSSNPPKVIYSVKGVPKFNSDCAYLLKDNLKRGKLRLLCTEQEADAYFHTLKGFKSLSSEKKSELLLPYIQTSLTINEIVNLKYEVTGTVVRVSEKGNDRKDRYSSLAYGNYFATELERQFSKKQKQIKNERIDFKYRKPIIRR